MKLSNQIGLSSTRKFLKALGIFVVGGSLSLCQLANAQTFPSKPVTIVVPLTPGGGADNLARILVPRLNALWGQSVIVEYRAGDAKVPIKRLHTMTVSQIKKEASDVGLIFDKVVSDLPWQDMVFFRKPQIK
jgi:hypothetical protein